MELFIAVPLTDAENETMTARYNGAYGQWTGALLHIADNSRVDLSYSVIHLSGYNNCPSISTYKIFVLFIPPPSYPTNVLKNTTPLTSHFTKGDAEITTFDYANHTRLDAYVDSDFTRDITSCRSTTSYIHALNAVATAWQCVKQPEPTGSSNNGETRSLFSTTRQTLIYRSLLASLPSPQQHPTLIFDDNKATLAQVSKDHLKPQVKHIDVLLTWLNE